MNPTCSGADRLHRLFLVGCARSGTTIAQKLISDAVGALTVPETNFFPALCGDAGYRKFGRMTPLHPLSALRARLDVAWPRRPHALRSLRELAEALGDTCPAHIGGSMSAYVRVFLRLLDGAATRGTGAWLEKSPNHLFYLDYIERQVPRARFVHVLRDGVDTVASLMDAGRKYGGRGNDFSAEMAPNVARWNQAMRWHRRYMGRPGHLLVTLEALQALDWPALLGIAAGAGAPAAAPIAREHEVWKKSALDGKVLTPEDKRGLFSAAERATLERALAAGGSLQRLFPELADGAVVATPSR